MFVDILVFSSLIDKNQNVAMDDTGVLIRNIPVIFDEITHYYSKEKQKDLEIKFFWGSDTIVVSAHMSNVSVILEELSWIASQLLNQSILIRGAITIGKLYHEDNMWGTNYVRSRKT